MIDRNGKGGPSEVITLGRGYGCLDQPNAQVGYGKPVAIMLEQVRGPLVEAVMSRENVLLYPVDRKQLAHLTVKVFPAAARTTPIYSSDKAQNGIAVERA